MLLGVRKQGTVGREREREQENRGGIQTMLGVVWCGPVTPRDITVVNKRR